MENLERVADEARPGQAEPSIDFHLGRLINGINERVTSETDYRKVLDFVFGALEMVIPFDRMGVALIEGEGDDACLKLEWMRSKAPVNHLDRSYSAPIKSSSLASVIETNTPRVLNDLIEYYAEHPFSASTKLALQDGVRSSLTCPLRAGSKNVGVLFFSSFQPNTYAKSHVSTFRVIADELAVVVDYGRLKLAAEMLQMQTSNVNMLLHDLRSPLGVIQGFIKASREEDWFQDLDQEAKGIFDILLRNSDQMFSLINEVLDISRLNRGSSDFKREPVDIPLFCLEMTSFARVLAESKRINVVPTYSQAEHSSPTFLIDKAQVRRVLENLFTNAIKFSYPQSTIEFHTERRSEGVVFSVTDQGVGIPEGELPNLFREFGRTSARPTAGETSTGLGLAIAKRIVELHGGTIGVKSAPGKGSTFTVFLPTSNA